MLLKDKLDHISKNFGSNFNSTGKRNPIKLAKNEKKNWYNNLFFETDYKSVVKDVDFLEEIGILYDNCIGNNYFKHKNWHYKSKWRRKK